MVTTRWGRGIRPALVSLAVLAPLSAVAGAPSMARSVAGMQRPVVVLQAGLGDGKESWSTVFGRIAESNTVFAYDRPGYGESPVTDGSRDPCTIAAELRSALREAGLAPPYVLVGHSFGGLYQYVFAKLYPQDVAGLVLLDPTHPDHWRRMQSDAPATAALMKAMRYTVFSPAMAAEFDGQGSCLDRIDTNTPLAIPVRLLTRTQFSFVESGSFESMVHSLEDDWRRLLGAKAVQRIPGAGHYIHHDQPDAVVQELQSLIGELPARGLRIATTAASQKSAGRHSGP